MIWLKRAGLVLLIIMGLIFFIGTPWGTQLTLLLASSQVDGLEIEHDSGGLWGSLTLNKITFNNESTDASISDLGLNIGWSCLFSIEVCIESLSIGNVNVDVITGTEQPETQTSEPQKVTLPIAIDVKSLKVNLVSLNIKDTASVEWQSLALALHMHKRFVLHTFLLEQPVVTLPPPKKEQETPEPFNIADIANWQYQPIDLPSLFIPVDAKINQFQIIGLKLRQQKQVLQAIHSIDLKAQVADSHISINQLDVDMPQGQLSFGGEVSPNYHIDLAADWLSDPQVAISVNGNVTVNGGPADLNIDGQVAGDIQASTQINLDLTSPQLPLSLIANWQDFLLPLETSLDVKTGKMELAGDMSEYQLLINAGVNVEKAPEVDAQIKAVGNLKQLQISQTHVNTLGGKISFDGTLDIDQKTQFDGQVNIDKIQLHLQWPEYESLINGQIELQAQADGQQTSAKVNSLALNGSWLGYAIGANGSAEFDSLNGLDVPEITLFSGNNKLNIAGSLSNQQTINFTIDGKFNELQALYPALEGEVQLNALVTDSLATPSIQYTLHASDVAYEQFSLANLTTTGNLIWDDIKPVDVSFSLSQLVSGDTEINKIETALKGKASDHRLSIELDSNLAKLSADITGTLVESSWQGAWNQGKIQGLWGKYELSQQADIWADWGKNRYGISAHCWQETHANLCVEQGQLEQQHVQFNIAANKLPLLQILSAFLPQTLDITSDTALSFNTQGDWQLDQAPQIQLKGALSPSSIILDGLTKDINMQKFDFSLQLQDEDLITKVNVETDNAGSVLLDGKVEQYANAANLNIDLQLDTILLNPYQELVPHLSELSGEVNGGIKVRGDKTVPLLNGQLKVSGVNLAGEALPGRIDNWNQNAEFAGQKVDFKGDFGFGNGRGKSDGTLDWSSVLVGELALTGNQFEIEYRDTVRARFSPDIAIELAQDEININGEVNLDYARIKVKELPPSAKKPSDDVVIINAPEEQVDSSRNINIQLQINIDKQKNDDVKLEAFGLKTDLQGELVLKQEVGKLSGLGELRLVNGTYKAYGQDLVIRKGNIQFSGPLDSPSLDILAIRDPAKTQGDVIAGIKVFGQAEQPSVDIYSEPTMIQGRALSYLVQGKDIGAESDGQSVDEQMLASVLLSVGLKNSENKVDKLGRKLGIEDLAIGAEDGSKVSLSGYIAPGVQLKYGVNVFDSSSEVTLRYQLIPKLFLEASNSGAESSLELLYQFSLGNRTKATMPQASE